MRTKWFKHITISIAQEHLLEIFRRTFLQNPKGSAEFWGGGGSPDLSFEDRALFLPQSAASLYLAQTDRTTPCCRIRIPYFRGT